MRQEYTTVNPIPEEMPPRTKHWPGMKKEIKRTGIGTHANLPKIKLNQMTSRIKLVPPWRNLSPPHLIYSLQNSEKSYCAAWHSKNFDKVTEKNSKCSRQVIRAPRRPYYHVNRLAYQFLISSRPISPPPRQVKIAHTTKKTSLYTN